MANTPILLAQGTLAVAPAALFVGTTGHTYTIASIIICNTDTQERTYTIAAPVASGGSITVATTRRSTMPIYQSDTHDFGNRWIITGTQEIHGSASADSVVSYCIFGIDSV